MTHDFDRLQPEHQRSSSHLLLPFYRRRDIGAIAKVSVSWLSLLATLLCSILVFLAIYYQNLRIADLNRQIVELRTITRALQYADTYVIPSGMDSSRYGERERRSLDGHFLHSSSAESRKGKKKSMHRRRSHEQRASDAGPSSELGSPFLRFGSSSLSASSPPCTCQGLPGPKGDRGDKGEKGARPILPSFITELAGPPGPKGEPGEPGPRGDRGPKGDVGKDCCDVEMVMRSRPNLLANLVGPPGEKGERGDPGHQGKQGERGPPADQRMMEDWAFRVKLQVMQGINNSICIPGPSGPPGLKGDKGDSGYDGKPGARGDKGEKGTRGRRGFKGDQGAPGLDAPCPIGPDGLPLPSCYAYYPPLGSSTANGNGAVPPPPIPNGNYKTVIVHQGQPVEPPTGPPSVLRLP